MTMAAASARGIVKQFGATRALDGVDFDVLPGEVHALVGENGAGKSTLVRILGGVHQPDRGEIAVDGRPCRFSGPRDAIAAGIVTIPQELRLVPTLSVAENLTLGDPPQRRVLGVTVVDRARMRNETREQLAQLDFAPNPDSRVDRLSFAERQLVAIAKALRRECRVLILDEPTAALETREIERLFAVLARMKSNGTAIIYVSHRLDEVVALADRCTVLRDGRIAATSRRGDFKVVDLVAAMTGSATAQIDVEAPTPGDAILEDIADRPDAIRLRAREVTGLAGLLGSGASAVLRRLFGVGGEAIDIRRDGVVQCIFRSATIFCCQASTGWPAAAAAESIAGAATVWSRN
jgi:ABC-type sugar transport system ATPase subunit